MYDHKAIYVANLCRQYGYQNTFYNLSTIRRHFLAISAWELTETRVKIHRHYHIIIFLSTYACVISAYVLYEVHKSLVEGVLHIAQN